MSDNIYLNIESISLYGTDDINKRELEESLRQVLQEYLTSPNTFRAIDVQRIQTTLNMSCTSFKGKELGRALGERIVQTLSPEEKSQNVKDGSGITRGESHA